MLRNEGFIAAFCLTVMCLLITTMSGGLIALADEVNRGASDSTVSPTPLDTIYQSLDFGAYPIDFDHTVTIDGIEYESGDDYDVTGVHQLIYTQTENQYSRDLVLYRLGDINCDNSIDIRDLIVLKKKIAGLRVIDTAGEKGADFSLDGTIGADDLILLQDNLLHDYDTPKTSYPENSMADLVDFTVEVESGRDIRVLQLTDPQIIESEQQRNSDRLGAAEYNTWLSTKKKNNYYKYVNYVIQKYNPDLILITGDVIYGEFDDSGAALLEFVEFMDRFKTPWAPVFGNHDNESYKGVDWQCEQFEKSKYCLFKQRTLTGNGNYTVGLKQDGKYKRVFFMLDSNGCSNMSSQSFANGHSRKATGFGSDQINWYSTLSQQMRYAQPDVKLAAAFHIQLNVFAKAFAQYGYISDSTTNLPINLDTSASAAESDFGYVGRKLKGPWDTNENVWYTLKNAGFDLICVGHEHCNSASVMYRGVRLQYGQKSSTYDRTNYYQSNGKISSTPTDYPVVGGTTIPVLNDGSIGKGMLFLYDQAQDDLELPPVALPVVYTETYDFNGTDFNVAASGTGAFESEKSVKAITDTSLVPQGYSEGVYVKTNSALDGMASAHITFADGIDVSQLESLKLRMYVTSYTPKALRKDYIRIYDENGSTILKSETFANLGGSYDEWCEVDILPLIREAGTIENDILSELMFTYQYYTNDATVRCYYDSLILVYSE